jgi:hypothetical protein
MNDDNKVLNLDELFGQARAVKLRWHGREYELLRMEGIGPKQATQFNALYLRAGKMQNALTDGTDVTEEQAEEVDEILARMLKILCADFPVEDVPFLAKMRAIQFYMEQTQGKKAMEATLKQLTGRKRSAG